jgi:ribonuclease D
MPAMKIKLVKNDLAEEDLEHYLDQELLAIDCEMMGLNPHRDRLCMVQLCDDGGRAILVQISLGQKSAPNLKKLFESSKVLKLFHYARTDLVWLKKYLGIQVENVFCTKVASKLARTYSDKHGLKELTKEIIGKDMNKQQQSSDWGDSEINKDQVQYAASDVQYLIPIYRKLRIMLERESRYKLALSCIEFLPVIAELDELGYLNVLEH